MPRICPYHSSLLAQYLCGREVHWIKELIWFIDHLFYFLGQFLLEQQGKMAAQNKASTKAARWAKNGSFRSLQGWFMSVFKELLLYSIMQWKIGVGTSCPSFLTKIQNLFGNFWKLKSITRANLFNELERQQQETCLDSV